MGSVLSSAPSGGRTTDHVTSESETMEQSVSTDKESETEEFHDTIDEDEARTKAKEEEMEEFRKQLKIKREQRKEILARHRSEKEELERSLENEKKAKLEAYRTNKLLRELLERNFIDIPEELDSSTENSDIASTVVRMTEEFERLKSSNNKLRVGLAEANNTLQSAYSDIADLTAQNTESIKQINALKEVISVSKTMINIREEQLNELKNKLHEIERSLADKEANMLSADLRQEYERQLQNIRTLRGLYEERARLAEVTRQNLVRDLEDERLLKEAEIIKCKDLTTKVEDLEVKVEELHETVQDKNNQIFACQEETRGLKAEMSVVNKLFSQVLLGYKTKQDLDKLVHRLEENHGILTHMAENENDSEASSALPKLLLEIVSQVDEGDENKEPESEADSTVEYKTAKEIDVQVSQNTSAEEIVENLPKVWRVLMELLSHQSTTEENSTEKVTTCYKSVETNSGPVLVPSVSQTYIRLKDLILEKLALIKEVNRMKQLNVHLETRLGEQERRLGLVTNELSKTWHVVGRLRRHHHQLHTHEKILKYELQQKRKLLNELKEELEYCREKWEQAREKNNQSEKDWRTLRAEFSSRKTKLSSCNNSAESGYSDERPSDDSSASNDESECVTEPLIKSKKKFKKSFETVLDSSTDINLAEREDPASDMIDVADLPLDTQDGDDNHDVSNTDSCSESLLKSEKVCETEDEIGDIANDSCVEETATGSFQTRENSPTKEVTEKCNEDSQTSSSNSSEVATCIAPVPVIDPAAILKSIKEQNERLAKRDKKLERLEKSGAALLKQTQTTAKISEQINSTLDRLLNRPTSSRQNNNLETEVSNPDFEEVNKVSLQGSNEDPTLENKIINKDETKDDITANIECSLTKKDTEKCGEDNQISSSNSSDVATFGSQVPLINPAAILRSTKEQDIRLATRDKKLVILEKNGAALLKQTQTTAKISEQINSTLDNLINRPTSSGLNKNLETDANADVGDNQLHEIDEPIIEDRKLSITEKNDVLSNIEKDVNSQTTSERFVQTTCSENEDFSQTSAGNLDIALVENDYSFQKSKNDCSNVVKNTLKTDEENKEIVEKLKEADQIESSENESAETKEETSSSTRDGSEPSTSSEMDHEARFAARDLRLKRLEEQTKSLVNKVNNTATKGVKIHYKLEELHNIYRSENSRAGTPSEDNEDRSQNDEETRD